MTNNQKWFSGLKWAEKYCKENPNPVRRIEVKIYGKTGSFAKGVRDYIDYYQTHLRGN